ncbi:MAG: hypothetical protein CVV27_12545 [Candidatus Melainabacteria bacterium HGW-Melainabacteria-1]|nr:MAG: hypothetical protein CVV27_12545 [Candidatus Melainabacteria bacterium HGW-Melainabacteria-1]
MTLKQFVSADPPVLPGLAAHYLVRQELGRGGMGVVYLGEDTRLERPVAIKVLLLNSQTGVSHQQETVLRFQREAKVIARLNHPNIVSIFDVHQAGDQYYMIMEYADGQTLSTLAGLAELSPEQLARIGQQICQALAYAHEHQIIHRDIKPGNIILTRRGEAKLMDFGIAQLQAEDSRLTQAGDLLGSLAYASPEQVQDAGSVDQRSDIFSLGITLYELITGQLPYQAKQLSALLLELLSAQPLPSVRTLRPDIPQALDQILQRAMRKGREDRYQSARDMAIDLAAVSGETVLTSLNFSQAALASPESPTRISLKRSTLLTRTRIDQALIQTLVLNRHWLLTLSESWQRESISLLTLEQVFRKVTDAALFGQNFSGLILIDQRWICFVTEGYFTGGLDLNNEQQGPEVFAVLPAQPQSIELRLAPPNQPQFPLILSNLSLGQGIVLHTKLDSSLIEADHLLASLNQDEQPFSGYAVCQAADNLVYFGYLQGEQIFAAAVRPLDGISANFNLLQLLSTTAVVMDVYRSQPTLAGPSIRQMLKQAHLQVNYANPQGTKLQTLADQGEAEQAPHLVKEARQNLQLGLHWEGQAQVKLAGETLDASPFVEQSLNYRLAQWLLLDYFFSIHATGNTTTLKYLYTWIAATQSLWFEQELLGADGQPRCFSMVTYGEIPGEGRAKVLHLLRIGSGQVRDVEQFLEDVISVKKHLIKSGDIGGALYLSIEDYSTEALKLFYARTVEPRKGLGLGSLDKLTKLTLIQNSPYPTAMRIGWYSKVSLEGSTRCCAQ